MYRVWNFVAYCAAGSVCWVLNTWDRLQGKRFGEPTTLIVYNEDQTEPKEGRSPD